MRVDVVSIFPDYLAPLRLSLIGRAVDDGLIDLAVHDLRSWTSDRHRTVDDTPYGGGPGMLMRPEPWGDALDSVLTATSVVVVPTPGGTPFSQALAHDLAGEQHLVFACGRYEGIDQRVLDESHSAASGGLLEAPGFTKPAVWRDHAVPAVLLSGDHGKVARWRRDQALRRTSERRPDLVAALDPAALDRRDLALLAELGWVPAPGGGLARGSGPVAD
jgi:tRNA (guanine37-N1)-methyltransferase